MASILEGLEVIEGPWLLVGAAALIGLAKGGRPLAKGAIKGYLAARDGARRLTATSRESMRSLYEEAATEYRTREQPARQETDVAAERERPMQSGGVILTPSAEAA